ncbi:3-oxoacyl-ACP reductase [Shewanella mangrovi]|uniref:3-oxoacyl-ACP reductase n=1 Tax=Shewanella mangrovi TaxID=1515746 RepID=A0A094JB79_9GAMM|nr:SDR family oxidoreductase [Shewanella mangrovi]KFZ36497.1 3-oxoacyl-ACP reductase [Shewanella mangrovi]
MNRLEGKIAIVTGGSRGIGRATAKLFAAEGAVVAVVSRTQQSVDEVVAEINADGGKAIAIACDICDVKQTDAAIKKVVETFGGIDILVNNAFDPTAPFSSVIDLSVEQLQRNFEIGPIAYLRWMQAAFPYLKQSTSGRVINFGSMAGVSGLVGYAPYNMAKEAVRALTRTAAREWAEHNITVNNMLPVAKTWGDDVEIPPPACPLGRYGSPEQDIAPVVLFLASDDSQYITGYSMTPDGGLLIDSAR